MLFSSFLLIYNSMIVILFFFTTILLLLFFNYTWYSVPKGFQIMCQQTLHSNDLLSVSYPMIKVPSKCVKLPLMVITIFIFYILLCILSLLKQWSECSTAQPGRADSCMERLMLWTHQARRCWSRLSHVSLYNELIVIYIVGQLILNPHNKSQYFSRWHNIQCVVFVIQIWGLNRNFFYDFFLSLCGYLVEVSL